MFPKAPLVLRMVTIALVFGLIGSSARAEESGQLRVRARITGQSYCRADSDLFTVSLKLEIEILNVSKESVVVKRAIIPWIAKVAPNIAEAGAGHFIFEMTQSHYPQDAKPSDTVRIDAGKSVTLHTGYDFVARYNPAFSYPKSISAGVYGVVLVLKPEMDAPGKNESVRVIESVTTEPFLLEVPKYPKILDCAPTGLLRERPSVKKPGLAPETSR